MSVFEFNWVDAPDAGDALEGATLAQLILRVEGQATTRVYDRAARSEREAIFVPLFPLARWVVDQWWSLLYEPWAFDEGLPGPGMIRTATIGSWLERHCLRVAVPGYAMPFVCISSQGADLALSCRADPRGRYAHMPVEFRESIDGRCEREALRLELAGLVTAVLARSDKFADPRVEALRVDWRVICEASAAEAEFCRAAGRLGLDPYATDGWPPTLLGWFEGARPGELDGTLVTDLLEAPDPSGSKPVQHGFLRRLVEELALGGGARAFGPGAELGAPFLAGYALARWVRERMQLQDGQALADLREASEAACDRALVVSDAPHWPDGRVLGLTGWNGGSAPVVANRRSGRPASDRFVRARGLYMALRGGTSGPRLVTDAKTWEQRASRAFGAELLAPRAGVLQRFEEEEARVGRDEALVRVADHYIVSPMKIQHQLENAANRGASEPVNFAM